MFNINNTDNNTGHKVRLWVTLKENEWYQWPLLFFSLFVFSCVPNLEYILNFTEVFFWLWANFLHCASVVSVVVEQVFVIASNTTQMNPQPDLNINKTFLRPGRHGMLYVSSIQAYAHLFNSTSNERVL